MTTAGMGNPTPLLGIKRLLSTTPIDPAPHDYLSRIADAVEEALTTTPWVENATTGVITPASGFTIGSRKLIKWGPFLHLRFVVNKSTTWSSSSELIGTLTEPTLRPTDPPNVTGVGYDNSTGASRVCTMTTSGEIRVSGAAGAGSGSAQVLTINWAIG